MSQQDEPEWMLDKLRELEERGEIIKYPPGYKPPPVRVEDIAAVDAQTGGLHPAEMCGADCAGCCEQGEAS